MSYFEEKVVMLLSDVIKELSIEEIREALEIPPDSTLGNFAFPCFRLAKVRRPDRKSVV